MNEYGLTKIYNTVVDVVLKSQAFNITYQYNVKKKTNITLT